MQANPPRFLYSHSEIIKRRDAVGVNVSYRLSTSLIYRAYDRQQDVRDLVLHIIADAPPPSWVRVQVRHSPACIHFLHARPSLESAIHPKASCPPRSWPHIHSAFPSSPSHLLHRESQRPHRNTCPTKSTTVETISTCRTSFLHRSALRGSRSVLWWRPLHHTHILPYIADPRPRRCEPHAFRPQHILPSTRQRRGEKEAFNRTRHWSAPSSRPLCCLFG